MYYPRRKRLSKLGAALFEMHALSRRTLILSHMATAPPGTHWEWPEGQARPQLTWTVVRSS